MDEKKEKEMRARLAAEGKSQEDIDFIVDFIKIVRSDPPPITEEWKKNAKLVIYMNFPASDRIDLEFAHICYAERDDGITELTLMGTKPGVANLYCETVYDRRTVIGGIYQMIGYLDKYLKIPEGEN